MDGLQFQTAIRTPRSDPARADIACFAGFAAPRQRGPSLRARLQRVLRDMGWIGPALPDGARVLPDAVLPGGDAPASFARWLERIGFRTVPNSVNAVDLFTRAVSELLGAAVAEWWIENDWVSPFAHRSAADLLELTDVPVPIDTWDAFDALFAWDRRPLAAGRIADTALGAAVRRFFLQGGRKCYVVAVDEPWLLFTPRAEREARCRQVFNAAAEPTPADRSTWRGVGHLLGLTDVSFLCVPDLPELFAVDAPLPPPDTESEGEERFVECAARLSPPVFRGLREFAAPRCDDRGFHAWSAFVARIARSVIGRHCREVQFLAAVPLPADGAAAQWDAVSSIQTAFVQLAYPWLRTTESPRLPGALEAPDATLAGLLGGNALTNGTWRSIAREPVSGVIALEPLLSRRELERPLHYQSGAGELRLPRTVRERVSVFAPTAAGFQILSDVTTDDDEAYRPASVNRLVASLRRAARLLGESAAFTNNGEATWRALEGALDELLLGLWGDGALAGDSAADAFEVRCDRSTMTQADLDAGRVIARVQFTAASPIDRVVVIFAMDEGGQVSLVAPAVEAAQEASA